MDDNDSLDQALTDLVGASTLTVADEDRAYRLIVDRARGRVVRRRLTASTVLAAVVAAIVIAAVVAGQRQTPEVRVQGHGASSVPTTTTTRTAPRNLPNIAGMMVVSDGSGAVGYAPEDLIRPTTPAAFAALNARTMIPVTLGDGSLVGYMALAYGFVPLAETKKPGFDIEALRARLNGGCEPQIGDPTFKQEFPRCPPPPDVPVPPTLGRRFGPSAPFERGIGQAQPSSIFLGGDPTGTVNHVHWQSWGGARATGQGTGYYVPPGKTAADAVAAPATVVAFDVGNCQGTRAYQAVEWFYPQHGGAFDAATYTNICTGAHVGNR